MSARNNGKYFPVGIWLRVSTEQQAEGDSPAVHLRRARSYCDAKEGWDAVEIYDLSGVSGKTILDHVKAKQMMEDVRTGKIKGLVFTKLARLARKTKELLEISEHFTKHDAALISIEESIDTSTPAGRLLYTVIGALAEWEREEISDRVKSAARARAQMGEPVGGEAPFGYVYENDKLVVHPQTSLVVKRIFELFLQTKKVRTTCTLLNSEGYRAPRGGDWGTTTLSRILKSSIYIGKRRAFYSTNMGKNKPAKLKPESEWIYSDVDPIVSVKDWNSVAMLIKERQIKQSAYVTKQGRYIYSGLVYCANCGNQPMYVFPYAGMKIPAYTCKVCRNKISEDNVTLHFRKAIEEMVAKPKTYNADGIDTQIKEKERRLKKIRSDHSLIDSKINKAWDKSYEGLITNEQLSERLITLSKQKEQLEQEISRLDSEIAVAKVAYVNRDFLFREATNLSEVWEILSNEERRRITKELIQKVEVGNENIHFVLYYLPEFSILEKGDCISMG